MSASVSSSVSAYEVRDSGREERSSSLKYFMVYPNNVTQTTILHSCITYRLLIFKTYNLFIYKSSSTSCLYLRLMIRIPNKLI